MTNTLIAPAAVAPGTVNRAGFWCVVAGLVGMVQGIGLLAWPEQVPDTRFSFPFDAVAHVVAQASFFVQHLPLVAAVVVLARVPQVRAVKTARIALLVGAFGLALLTLMEIVAMSAATTELDSTLGQTISALYGPPVILIGAGLVVGGIVVRRRGLAPVVASWSLIAIGAWVFVGITPALASGDFVAGRLSIVVWMGMFVALGHSLRSASSERWLR